MADFMKNIFGKSNIKEVQPLSEPQTMRKPDLPAQPKGTTALRPEEAPSGPDFWVGKIVPVFQIGDVILDTYEVKDVKSGGMGNVYIVQDSREQQMLAIKAPNQMMLSHPDFFARVLREADAWTDLGVHPHIAFCYYIQKIDAIPHIFIEYVDGGNLEEWIAGLRCDDLKVSLDMAIQFCHGMEHAHQHGLIHRDIKPRNILVTKEGILKITDFGIARKDGAVETGTTTTPELWSKSLTSLGAMGTYDYMPPEQFEDPHGVDGRADIFAFGVCLYEMICGRRPYDATSLEAGTKGLSPWEPAQLREDIPAAVADLLKRSVALEKGNRYASFAELRKILIDIYQNIFNDQPAHAEITVLEMKADVLNNRGVSYWHLGNREAARKCWELSLMEAPAHLEATVNLGYLQWSDREITNEVFLLTMKELEIKHRENPNYWRYLAQIYLAQGKPDEILKIQQSDHQVTDPELIREFNNPGRWFGREIRQFKGHTSEIRSVCFSPDGRYLLSGDLRLWDLTEKQQVRRFGGYEHDFNKRLPAGQLRDIGVIANSICFSADGQYILSGEGGVDQGITVSSGRWPAGKKNGVSTLPVVSKRSVLHSVAGTSWPGM